MITFYPKQKTYFTSTKSPDHHISSTVLEGWCQAILRHRFICSAPHKTFLLCHPNLHLNTFSIIFHLVFFPFAHFSLFTSLVLALKDQQAKASPLMTMRPVFYGYYLIKRTGEDL